MPTAAEYQECIDACLTCAAICNDCATSSLREKEGREMAACVKKCLECAAICYATAHLMSLNSSHAEEISRLCATMCEACLLECSKYATEACRKCIEGCGTCIDACSQITFQYNEL